MVNVNSPIPLHIQLKQLIQHEIMEGKYADKIPSERELMERFQVSRSTVRESINHLVQDQIVEKVHGKGTFIRSRKTIHDWLNSLHSFTETVKRMGMVPSATLLSVEEHLNDAHIQSILQCDELFSFARLRSANQKPIAIERHYYSQPLGEKMKQFNLNDATIYDLLEQNLGITLHEAEQTIKVVAIEKEDAEYLHLTPDKNVLCVERIITGVMGEPIEYYRSIFHPNYYELKLKTKRQQ